MICAQCGAAYATQETCAERFGQCLALEYENPAAFGAVHHLTVLCYMLQHNVYSREAWFEAREMLEQFVHGGVTPAGMRKQLSDRLDRGKREWSVTRGPKLAEFDAVVWTRTIADVRLDNPEVYCMDVEEWAVSVLADTHGIAMISK